ncbi:MAG: glutamate racemase [Parachlamydiales bacterium]|nr:glutamate racemase [Parachlamydiales bacterium]
MKNCEKSLQGIGIFDSGLGGLTVLEKIKKNLPAEDTIYIADTKNFPYGTKPINKIRQFTFEISSFLKKQNVKIIVVACHTASSLAIDYLRKNFDIPILDVIDPTIDFLKNCNYKNILVLATKNTAKSKIYEKKFKFANPNINVLSIGCSNLVETIENKIADDKEIEFQIKKCLKDIDLKKFDSVILGCTHFPILKNHFRKILPKHIEIIDPSLVFINYLKSFLEKHKLLNNQNTKSKKNFIYASKTETNFQQLANTFFKGKIKKILPF